MSIIQSLLRFRQPASYQTQLVPNSECELHALDRLSTGKVTALDPLQHAEPNPTTHWPAFKNGVISSFSSGGDRSYYVGVVIGGNPTYFSLNFGSEDKNTDKQREQIAKAVQAEATRIISEPSMTITKTAAKLAFFLASISPCAEVTAPYRRYVSNVHRAEYLLKENVTEARIVQGSAGDAWYVLFSSADNKNVAQIEVDSRFLERVNPKTFLESYSTDILNKVYMNRSLTPSASGIVAVAEVLDNLALACCQSSGMSSSAEIVVRQERADIYELLFNIRNRAGTSVRTHCALDSV